jgi:uncharacterized short protein YbdD (DUF466 family)
MNLLINFATDNFKRAQDFNSATAGSIGDFDYAFSANPSLIDSDFRHRYNTILNQARGAGYWLWKPYFILKILERANNGDIVMYADAASHFISSAAPLFSLPAQFNQDIIPFELELPESAWTKRDTFIALDADDNGYELSPQRLASFILLRKSTMSLQFCQDYLNYCTNEQALTDATNIYGKPNYDNFVSHRHDQSIFSLLTKKYGLQAFRDPSQWGNNCKHLYTNSDYPQIIEHTRQKNPKQATLSYKIKRFLFPKK